MHLVCTLLINERIYLSVMGGIHGKAPSFSGPEEGVITKGVFSLEESLVSKISKLSRL